MTKLPLFLNGALVDNGRKMTKTEARKLAQAVYGEKANVVATEGIESGTYSKQWRAIY